MANEGVATFNINLEGNAPAVSTELAERVDKLRQQIQGSTDKITGMGKALKALRGDAADVVAAKDKLRAAIGAEKDAISASNLELIKHGVVLGKAGKASEDAGERFAGLKDAAKTFGTIGIAAAAAVGAVVALTGALVAGAVALAKWIINTGDAGRNAALLREAFAGSAENGERLGTQVDALARKVPIAKDELNKLATSLMRTRLSGQAIVDTMNIVGEASGAMGDSVGNALGEIVKRGQLTRRFRIDPRELFGTGVKFNDVAAQLAKQLNIGVAQAKDALFTGAVSVDQGAKALRAVVEKQFGAINAKKLISIDAITQSLHDRFVALTKNIDFERILGPISKMAEMFDTSTVTGKVLQDILTNLGKVLGDTFTGATPKVKDLFLLAEIGALKLLIGFFKVKIAIEKATGSGNLFLVPLTEAKNAFAFMLAAVDKIVGGFRTLQGLARTVAGAVGIGSNTGGTKEGFALPKPEALTAPGHAEGGIVARPAPGEYFASVAPGEAIIPRGSGEANGGGVAGRGGIARAEFKFDFHIHAGSAPAQDIAQQLAAPNFTAQLTKAIEDACRAAGIPTQQVAQA